MTRAIGRCRVELYSVLKDMNGNVELRLRKRTFDADLAGAEAVEMTPHGHQDIVFHMQTEPGVVGPQPGTVYHMDLTPVDDPC